MADTSHGRVEAWTRFRKVRTIGAGGSGQVYLVEGKNPAAAMDPSEVEDSLFVAKRVFVDDSSDEQRVCAAMEVKVLQIVPRHPNIVAFVDHFLDTEGYLNIIMEHCAHGDLERLIAARAAANKPFSLREVVWLTFQLLCGVRHLHRNQIVHRDIKPGNVFITQGAPVHVEATEVHSPATSSSPPKSDADLSSIDLANVTLKVADFGISKVMRNGSYAHSVVGTPFYIAPEICESRPYTNSADMWAVGCIVYEVCALAKLFAGENMLAVIRQISAARIPDLPAEYAPIQTLVHELVDPDPQKRLTADQCILKYFAPRGGSDSSAANPDASPIVPAHAPAKTPETVAEL